MESVFLVANILSSTPMGNLGSPDRREFPSCRARLNPFLMPSRADPVVLKVFKLQ